MLTMLFTLIFIHRRYTIMRATNAVATIPRKMLAIMTVITQQIRLLAIISPQHSTFSPSSNHPISPALII